MDIQIDNNTPWLEQIKPKLFKRALKETNGNRVEAAQLLGCSTRTVSTEIQTNPDLIEYKNVKHVTKVNMHRDLIIDYLFNLGYRQVDISIALNTSIEHIHAILKKKYTAQQRKDIRRNAMFNSDINVEEILADHKLMLTKILSKFHEGKPEDLSDEHLMYAKIMLDNELITGKGEVTEKGKQALYQ